MSSITNVNQNSSVVNVGRTTPVSPGAQTADKSIPVVMATDQSPIPVIEQNKVQSEVALSLLGIPRAEVALGIFADVNTYDVNPTEWSTVPEFHNTGFGIQHRPTEAGALVEAPRNKTAVLTSKRFFRYQPGRVSAATFGIRSSVGVAHFAQNPVIRKFGIYDKYDGYYWESRNSGKDDNFTVVRRTQSVAQAPTSPYGFSASTILRGDNAVASRGNIPNNQIDDYRMVGLGNGEKDIPVGLYPSARKVIQENRYAIIDNALDYATAVYDTFNNHTNFAVAPSGADVTIGGSFYVDLAEAYNVGTGALLGDAASDTALKLTAPQMEAKCKRDLDYWIDNILLDLQHGGDGHIRFNTTNFALSNGTDASSTTANWTAGGTVGVFPKITAFEKIIHTALSRILITNKYYAAYTGPNGNIDTEIALDPTGTAIGIDGTENTVTVATKLGSLLGLLVTLSGGTTTAAFDTDTFQVQNPSDTTNATFGTKSKLDTFFDVKKNFWAYYVTIRENVPHTFGTFVQGKKYVITATGSSATFGNWNSIGCTAAQLANQIFVGRVFVATGTGSGISDASAEARPFIEYTVPSYGTSSNDADTTSLNPFIGLSDTQIKEIIKNKCQRDVGYVIDGYKNDIVGGGDMETAYNMSMFLRGTGLSVYSQQAADGSGNPSGISEPLRHTYLRSVIDKDLKAFSFPSSSTETTKLNTLASAVIANFGIESTKSPVSGDRGFAGNLVVLRDGLIHVHAGVYDPSILKDVEQIKSVVTSTSTSVNDTVPTLFKLTKGNVTFGQHVRITWDNVANPETPIVELDFALTTPNKLYKGEVVRVRRVIGPKGNEFTATKEDGTLITVDQTKINTVNFYVETVVPFIFPKDYDLETVFSSATAFTSEIDTSAVTLSRSASVPFHSDNSIALGSHREFRTVSTANIDSGTVPKGAMFPYMYATGDNLLNEAFYGESEGGKYLGFINTALDPNENSGANVNIIRSQIDNVNFYPEYVNWIKNNVRPEYWGVYEYRVPRSRFSHDALDGISSLADTKKATNDGSRKRVYSDVATGGSGTVRPGQQYVSTGDVEENQDSLYKYDLTKVTMLKIEFSWYGAVGALFLAYVPVANGEARWVRVHHLRASNQLKIASLGNATLPITYTTYGGGSQYSLGDQEDVAGQQTVQDYGSISHNIVKYGASYYIDGGDRGTVRLYSHNNDATVAAKGKQFGQPGGTGYQTGNIITGETTASPTLAVKTRYDASALTSTTTVNMNGSGVFTGTGFSVSAGDFVRVIYGTTDIAPGTYKVHTSPTPSATTFALVQDDGSDTALVTTANASLPSSSLLVQSAIIDPRFFMGATVKTLSQLDQNVKVIWADSSRVFLSSTLQNTGGIIDLLADRSSNVYGIETKKEILSTKENNAVRNRVQVYPTKLSTSNGSPDNNAVRLRFKKTPIFQSNVVPSGTFTLTADHIVDSSNSDLPVTDGATPYLLNGEETYGWFRARVGTTFVTSFGKLYKIGGSYKFESLESFNGILTLNGDGQFLPDLKFFSNGETTVSTTITSVSSELEGLSSVKITSNPVVPVPNTGTNVATIYLQKGTEQFDLSTYFDYNKEYLSFPLTNIADSLYFAIDSDTPSTNPDDPISLGVTWEEQ